MNKYKIYSSSAEVADEVKGYFHDRGIALKDVAREAGISKSTLSVYLNGSSYLPRKIATFLSEKYGLSYEFLNIGSGSLLGSDFEVKMLQKKGEGCTSEMNELRIINALRHYGCLSENVWIGEKAEYCCMKAYRIRFPGEGLCMLSEVIYRPDSPKGKLQILWVKEDSTSDNPDDYEYVTEFSELDQIEQIQIVMYIEEVVSRDYFNGRIGEYAYTQIVSTPKKELGKGKALISFVQYNNGIIVPEIDETLMHDDKFNEFIENLHAQEISGGVWLEFIPRYYDIFASIAAIYAARLPYHKFKTIESITKIFFEHEKRVKNEFNSYIESMLRKGSTNKGDSPDFKDSDGDVNN